MAYTKINWEDAPSEKTGINAKNLNHMEEGIVANEVAISRNLSTINTHTSNIGSINGTLNNHTSRLANLEHVGDLNTRSLDLHTIKKVGVYSCGENAIAVTQKNGPKVAYRLEVKETGPYGSIIQLFYPYDMSFATGAVPTYQTFYASANKWGGMLPLGGDYSYHEGDYMITRYANGYVSVEGTVWLKLDANGQGTATVPNVLKDTKMSCIASGAALGNKDQLMVYVKHTSNTVTFHMFNATHHISSGSGTVSFRILTK